MKKRTLKWSAGLALMVAGFYGATANAAPITYTFVNNGYFDGGAVRADGQIGGTATEGGVTLTTVDVIGADGTRLSVGDALVADHYTSIGSSGGLAVNSSPADELSAVNFDSLEAWEFNFDSNIYLESITLNSLDTGTSFTLSSLTAEFADITLDVDGANSLGTTFVTAGTTLRISYNAGGLSGSAKIPDFTVNTIPEPATLGLISACAIGALAIRRFHI